MIVQREDGLKIVTLGENSTYISQLLVGGEQVSSGIVFSNTALLDGKFQGDEVLIQIQNFQGAISYMKGIVDLLQTWDIEGTEEQIADLQRCFDMVLKK